MYKCKNLDNKSQELSNLKFSGDLLLFRVCPMKTNNSHTNVDNLEVPGRFTLPGSLTLP